MNRLLAGEEGIAVVGGRNEGFLDGAGAEPAIEVQDGTRLIVGAARAGSAEGLLADNGAGRLVVDVEVACAVSKLVRGQFHRVPILGDHRAGEGVGGGLVDQFQGLLELVLIVDVDRQDRAKDLFAHGGVLGIVGFDDRGLNEVALRFVISAANQNLLTVGFGLIDVARDLIEASLVDDRVDEVAEVLNGADLERLNTLNQLALDLVGDVARDVGAGGGGALLALILEGAAEEGGGDDVAIGALVSDDEVLAAGLTDDSGVGAVVADVLADGLPHLVEDAGGAGEVDTSEIWVLEADFAQGRAVYVDEVDDAFGKSGFDHDAHEHLGAIDFRVGGLPDHDVSAHGGGGGEVAGDGGEVEGGNGEDETFERSVFQAVVHAGAADGLLAVDLAEEVDVEAEEVHDLTSAIDLGLERVLALAEHRGAVKVRAVLGGDEVGGAKEDVGAVLPTRVGPGLFGF